MISAVVLAKNEERNLKDCLSGLSWCDEIIVIDDNSKDKTEIMAKRCGAKVMSHSLEGDFSRQRNFGLNMSKGGWIFFVDADERVSPALAEEIKKKTRAVTIVTQRVNGFYLKRRDFFMGRWLRHGEIGGWGKIGRIWGIRDVGEFGGVEGFGKLGGIKILRLAKKEAGLWSGKVDEKWMIKGKTETLVNPLLHYPHPRLAEFLESINERSSLNAQQFYKDGVKMGFLEWLKPLVKFVWNYFFLGGFLDGAEGFVFAVLMSMHSFLVRGKLYLLWKKS